MNVAFLKDLEILKEADKIKTEREIKFKEEWNRIEEERLKGEREKEEIKRLEKEEKEKKK